MSAGEWWRRMVRLFTRDELEEELRLHQQMRRETLERAGMDAASARALARRQFGNAAQIADESRDLWRFAWLSALGRDVRFAVRSLVRRPGFALVAVLSLAITIGANAAVFAFAREIVFRSLPVAGAGRLVLLHQHVEQFHLETTSFSYRFFEQLRREDTGFEDVAVRWGYDPKVTDRHETAKWSAEIVSPNYFGGNRRVRVAGVVADSRLRALVDQPEAVLYLPVRDEFHPLALHLAARSTAGGAALPAQLESLVKAVDPRVAVTNPKTMEMQIDAQISRERLLAMLSTWMAVVSAVLAAIGLYGAVSFSLTRRTREVGIRLALGAGRATLFAQLLRDTALVVLVGLVSGVGLALATGKLSASLLFGLEPHEPVLLTFAVIAVSAAALSAAAVPAIRSIQSDPVRALKWE